MIGIFWIVDGNLIAKKVNLTEIEELNGFKDSGLSHFFEREKMGFEIDEYDKLPRGRIVYDVFNGKFLIYTAKEIIKNENYKQWILDFFNIKRDYKFIYDEHYVLKEKNESGLWK